MKATLAHYAYSGRQQHLPSKQQFQKLFEQLCLFVFAIDLDGCLVYVHQNSRVMLGYEAEELIGKPLHCIIHQDHHEEVDRCLQQLIRGAGSGCVEARLKQKHGDTISASWTLMWDAADKLYYGAIKDISEEKITANQIELHQQRAEEELRVSNERFRLAAKSSAIYDWNLLTNHLLWGEGLFDLLGYHTHELQMEHWETFLHPDEREGVIQNLDAVIHDPTKTSWDVEYRIMRKDDTYCYVLEKSQIIRDHIGKAVRMVGFIQDISERKKAEDKLHQLSLIAQQTDNLVIITNANGNITWVNNAFTRFSGFTLAEVAGHKPGHILRGPESDTKVTQYMREKIAKGEPFTVEILNYTKDKKKYWVENYCQPVRDEHGKLVQFFAIQNNITERKKLEAELLAQQKRMHAAVIAAQEKERAQVGQELHDNVNQVLTTVKLYAELCRDGIGNTPDIMNKSIKLLQESINEIRGLSKRLSAPSLGNIKLKDTVKELIDSVMVTKQVALYFDAFSIDGLEVDHEMHLCIYRILQEHLTNILKHAAASEVYVLLRVHKGELLLQVDDDGKGFDTSKKRSGIGITNMITRTESLKGTLSIVSSPGLGCQLTVSLPL